MEGGQYFPVIILYNNVAHIPRVANMYENLQ